MLVLTVLLAVALVAVAAVYLWIRRTLGGDVWSASLGILSVAAIGALFAGSAFGAPSGAPSLAALSPRVGTHTVTLSEVGTPDVLAGVTQSATGVAVEIGPTHCRLVGRATCTIAGLVPGTRYRVRLSYLHGTTAEWPTRVATITTSLTPAQYAARCTSIARPLAASVGRVCALSVARDTHGR